MRKPAPPPTRRSQYLTAGRRSGHLRTVFVPGISNQRRLVTLHAWRCANTQYMAASTQFNPLSHQQIMIIYHTSKTIRTDVIKNVRSSFNNVTNIQLSNQI